MHPSALPCSSSIGFHKPFDQSCPNIHNTSPTTSAISAINWCQEHEPSGFLGLLVSSWLHSDNVNNDSPAAPALTFCACFISSIPQMMPSHDAHHLALKRQGKVRQVHRNVCEHQKSVLSFKPKKLFKDIMVKRAKLLEKNQCEWEVRRGFWCLEINCDEFRNDRGGFQEHRIQARRSADRLKTYLRMCTMMRRKIW